MNQGSLLKAALLGGVLAGIASALPLLSLLCCAWGMGGGAFAAWVTVSDSAGGSSTSRCATAGWLSGLIAGAVSLPLQGYVNQLIHGVDGILEESEDVFAMMGSGSQQFSPEMMEAVIRGTSFIDFNIWSVFATCVSSFLFSLLGLLGGLIGSALFRRKKAAAGVGADPAFGSFGAVPPAPEPTPEESGELSADELPELPPQDDEQP